MIVKDVGRWALALALLANPLWGCDDDDGADGQPSADRGLSGGEDQGIAPQDAGPQEDAGGGEEAPVDPLAGVYCGGGPMTVFQVSGLGAGESVQITGSTTDRNDYEARCAGEPLGADALIAFVSEDAGFWELSTEGTAFDSVLYALRDCNDGFSEFACNDDASPRTQTSRIVIETEPNKPVFVVVDQYEGLQAQPFQLTARRAEASPPRIDDQRGALYPDGSLSARVSGFDESGLKRARIELLDEAGENLIQNLEAAIEDLPFLYLVEDEETGLFEFVMAAGLDTSLVGEVVSARFTLFNALGFEAVAEMPLTPPPPAALDGDCDNLVVRCVEGTDCKVPEGELDGVCALGPELLAGTGYLDSARARMGVQVSGSAAGAPIEELLVLPVDRNGNPLSVFYDGERYGGYAPVRAEHLPTTEGFEVRSRFAAFFVEACADATSQERFDRCLATTLGKVQGILVRARDADGLRSAPIQVALGERAEIDLGDLCDPHGIFDLCPEALACYSLDEERPLCAEPTTECGEGWPVVELSEHIRSDGQAVYAGTTVGAASFGGGGSCGGGSGPQVLHRFVAPEAGEYWAETGGTEADTLLIARTHCGIPYQTAYELGCNDDISSSNQLSRVLLTLEEGEVAWIFVDGAGAGFEGRYTLTVRSRRR